MFLFSISQLATLAYQWWIKRQARPEARPNISSNNNNSLALAGQPPPSSLVLPSIPDTASDLEDVYAIRHIREGA